MTIYIGFAIADSMFPYYCLIKKQSINLLYVIERIESGAISCVNPSHVATINVLKELGIKIHIPEKPPIVSLEIGDSIIVCSTRGLPRLTDRHEYTKEEIAAAVFTFSEYNVMPQIV